MSPQAFRQYIRLSCNVKVYVPNTDNSRQDKTLSADRRQSIVDRTLRSLSEWFGGSTAHEGLGCWAGNDGLVKERVTICEAFASTEALEEHAVEVVTLAEGIKQELSQEAVAVEVNGELYLI